MKRLFSVLFVLMLSFYSYGGIIVGNMMMKVGETQIFGVIFADYGTVEWIAVGNGITVSGSYESASVTAVKYGTYVIQAKLRNYYGIVIDVASQTITVEPFFDGPSVFGDTNLVPNHTYIYEVTGAGGISYVWSFPSEYFDVISGIGSNRCTVKTKNKLGSEYIIVKVSYPDRADLTSGLPFTVAYPSKIIARTNFICINDTISYQIPNAGKDDIVKSL